MGNAEDDHTSRSAIITIPGRPEALREGPSARDDGEGSASERADASGQLPNGATMGRYIVTGCVGTGGMGVVYSARDPDLDRRVALKVLRPELSVEPGSRARLLREARAMAQLSHPNVVPIYDVGVLGDQVFIAMELVDGVTLRYKLDRKTPWRTVVRTYLEAARGLAAAHAAGLVHRDFKPDNVLCGNDGRIRVVDFGLVSVDPAEFAAPRSHVLESGMVATVETTAGSVLGTPAFMAPEAMRGEPTDARADQFSFCVALFHGLYGVYPYTGDTLAERAEQIARGAIARPVGSAVPDRVYRVLARGLCARPESRYRSMEALANALEHAIGPRQRPRVVALAATGAVVIGALIAFVLIQGRDPPPAAVEFGRPETIARGDASQLAVTMLRDGRYLRVEHGALTVVAANGVSVRALTTPARLMPTRVRPSSVDGQVEVYATGVPCSWWLVPVDGGPWRQLLDDPSCASEVALSPDGTQLAITRAGELRIRDFATGAERTVLSKAFGAAASGGRIPSWSPDGTRLVMNGEISIVDVRAGTETHFGRIGAAACWLDADHIAYVTKTWFHNEIHVVDLRTGADRMVLETEGATYDLAASRGGLFVRRDEFHSRVYLASTAQTSPTSVEQLPQLDTGSAIDFIPAVWTPEGAVITVALVAGKRGLVQTVLGQRGSPLVLHRARDIVFLSSTQHQIIYSFNDGDDCEIRVFDLGTRQDRFWRNLRCAQQPHVTCAWSPARCIVFDDAGPRWFDPASMQFVGQVPHFERSELISPDAKMSVRLRGMAVIRDLASGAETTVELPAADGPLYVGWGHDSSTLVAIAAAPGHHRMLVRAHGGHWRTIIDEPDRTLNGYVVSPDGSQVAVITLLPASTWSYFPFTSPLRK